MMKRVNNQPFRSYRQTADYTSINRQTILVKLDIGKAFKGYYYSKLRTP